VQIVVRIIFITRFKSFVTATLCAEAAAFSTRERVPTATNVVVVLVVVIGVLVIIYHQIFKVLKLLHFATDRN